MSTSVRARTGPARKSAVYTEGNINGIYRYMEILGYPITLTTSGQRSHHFGH